LSAKVPVPDVDQVAELAPPPILPDVVKVDPSQAVSSVPAETVAAGSMVSIMSSVAAVQGPAPSGSSVVMVSVTLPAAMSAAEGV
jgi:hypothetical protein